MRQRIKFSITTFGLLLVTAFVLFFPAFPWSVNARHYVRKVSVKTRMRLARLRGIEPRLVSIRGTLFSPGARVESLDSRSGWAAVVGQDGSFVIPDVMWYPGASYDLVVDASPTNVRYVSITSPSSPPANREFNIGSLPLTSGCRISAVGLPGLNSTSYFDYDSGNSDFYKRMFDSLTAAKTCDAEKFAAINHYVSTRLNYEEAAGDFLSVRQTLEHGSRYCGCLSLALAAIAEAGGYSARVLDLWDGGDPPTTHMVAEVYYAGGWHLYDPTFDSSFLTPGGSVAGYTDIRLNPGLIDPQKLKSLEAPWDALRFNLQAIYGSGYVHYYYFRKKKDSCALWWPFRKLTSFCDCPDAQAILSSAGAPAGFRLIAAAVSTYRLDRQQAIGPVCRACDLRAEQALRARRDRNPDPLKTQQEQDPDRPSAALVPTILPCSGFEPAFPCKTGLPYASTESRPVYRQEARRGLRGVLPVPATAHPAFPPAPLNMGAPRLSPRSSD